MHYRNVKSERILSKSCALDSKIFCEICTNFRQKILSDSKVTSVQILVINYLGFQYSILQSLSDVF